MTSRSTPQYVKIQFPQTYEIPIICCPICGHNPLPEEAIDVDPCDHLSFVIIYVSGLYTLQYRSKSFRKKYKYTDSDEIDLADAKEKLIQSGFDQRLIIFEADYWGPYTSLDTDLYGYDLSEL